MPNVFKKLFSKTPPAKEHKHLHHDHKHEHHEEPPQRMVEHRHPPINVKQIKHDLIAKDISAEVERMTHFIRLLIKRGMALQLSEEEEFLKAYYPILPETQGKLYHTILHLEMGVVSMEQLTKENFQQDRHRFYNKNLIRYYFLKKQLLESQTQREVLLKEYINGACKVHSNSSILYIPQASAYSTPLNRLISDVICMDNTKNWAHIEKQINEIYPLPGQGSESKAQPPKSKTPEKPKQTSVTPKSVHDVCKQEKHVLQRRRMG